MKTSLVAAVCLAAFLGLSGDGTAVTLNDLTAEQTVADFSTEAVYLNANQQPMGARFRHLPSGFILDLLRIQSVPQAFTWVNSIPPSNQGEPHTCEHLLLGKGTRGRFVASLEDMSLGSSSAFTRQLETCYHFNAPAGTESFFSLFEAKLYAMIHPNYSAEEIRREVANIGYSINPEDSTIRLEEKGTVYNEMVSSYERPWARLYDALDDLLYGAGHPLSLSSGGEPSAIRTMTVEQMRKFQSDAYQLNNMGTVVSIPNEIELAAFLERISAILERIDPDATVGEDPARLYKRLPEPNSAPYGAIRMVSFPHQNPTEPGLLTFAWPPVQEMDAVESYLFELFLSNYGSGQTSNLYRRFINSETRDINIGASSVFVWTPDYPGRAVYVGFNNVAVENLTETMIDSVRSVLIGELKKIAAYEVGSDQLQAFNDRVNSQVVQDRRNLRQFLNSPPGFGFRGSGSQWMEHLRQLHDIGGFERQLAMDDTFDKAERRLASDGNVWAELIRKWRLTKIEPYAAASRPDPKLLEQSEKERETRIESFVISLMERYGVSSRDAAIAQYKQEYDEGTEIIDKEAATIEMPGFVEDPPMTLDEQLIYSVEAMPGGGASVVSTFDNITSGTAGLVFDMYSVPESLLVYVSMLPSLMTSVGVIMDGEPVAYDEMTEALRREISSLSAYYTSNYRTERIELQVEAAGSNAEESQRAMQWLEAVMRSPDWRVENLSRIRDAVDLALSSMRNRMRGSEESWVNDPAYAFWKQDNKLLLATESFLTRAHNAHRLRWLLKEAASRDDQMAFVMFMEDFKKQLHDIDRDKLSTFLKAKSESSEYDLVKAAARDLTLTLSDLPDNSLADDLRYLANQMSRDLAVAPSDALAQLKETLRLLRNQGNVRSYVVANSTDAGRLKATVDKLVASFPSDSAVRYTYDGDDVIYARLGEREPFDSKPQFVGLINNNTRSGVHINTVDCAHYHDYNTETVREFVAARLYGGGGAHSMFMKTWSAGLAYSNGLRSAEGMGRIVYYAERCPDLAQTMQFVVDQLKAAPYDPSLAEYAVAQAFSRNRAASDYEGRGRAMAADLADGVTPEKVRGFRQTVLDLKQDDDLYRSLHNLMPEVYGPVLPGYGATASQSATALYFVIGPDGQMDSYNQYLGSVESKDAKVYRLYPRDYWLVH